MGALVLLKAAWSLAKKIPWWAYVAVALIVYHFAAIHVAESRQRKEDDARWQKKEAQAQAAYDAKVAELEKKNRATESKWEAAITQQGIQYANDLQAAQDQSSRDVAAARAGALKLRYRSSRVQAGNRAAPQASADSGQSGQSGTIELPREVAANLYALADDADRVANKFNACLAILEAERK